MTRSAVARRYATALFEIARERGQIDAFEHELKRVTTTLTGTREARRTWEHRLIPPAEKKDILNRLFGQELSDTFRGFLHVVIEKHREKYLEAIRDHYQALADGERQVVEVLVTSARKLKDEQRAMLVGRLEASLGKNVRLVEKTDPSLLGGLVIRIGDQKIDGSVRQKLMRLRHQMVQEQPTEGGYPL